MFSSSYVFFFYKIVLNKQQRQQEKIQANALNENDFTKPT